MTTPENDPAAPLCTECGRDYTDCPVPVECVDYDGMGTEIGRHLFVPPSAASGVSVERAQEPCCSNAELSDSGDDHYCHVLGVYAPVVYLNAGYRAALRAEWGVERTRLRTALEEIEAKQPAAIETLREHGIVFTAIGNDPKNWQHVAFTFYTDVAELSDTARRALAGEEEPHA